MINNRTTSAIDLAFQIHHTPVGNLFVTMRHGRMKRCFSRDTAIRYLAFFMTSKVFTQSGFTQRLEDVLAVHPLNPDLNCWQRGGVTTEYYHAHQRCIRRIRRILARKRQYQKWKEKHDVLVDRFREHLDKNPLKTSNKGNFS